MDISQLSELPTTVIGLLAFVCLVNLVGMGYMLRYFLSSQKQQTEKYMDYIQTKNGHLEKARADFGAMIKDARDTFAATLMTQTNNHREMLNDAARRLEVCESRRR